MNTKKKLTKEQQKRLNEGAKEFADLKALISPFVKKRKVQVSITRGKWRDGQLASKLPSE